MAAPAPSLRVMQWNALADGLAQFGDFHWQDGDDGNSRLMPIPRELLDWEQRGPQVLDHILSADADVVCLQEVNHYHDFLVPRLAPHGYHGSFRAKISSPATKYGFPADGSAIFFRTSRCRAVEFRDPGRDSKDRRSLERVVLRLLDLASNKEFVVATKHFKAKAGRENEKIRLGQARSLGRVLSKVVTGPAGDRLPCIVCGDFNDVPASEVYAFMRSHELGFRSVYSGTVGGDPGSWVRVEGDGAGGEPVWTTWKCRSSGLKMECIDYIWVSRGGQLRPSRVRVLPSCQSLGPRSLPSPSMPSDHVPLLCDFVWS